jgi:N-acetylmuramoyl-L-alanine amidase
MGARGGAGVLEKDVVRFLARVVSEALQRAGWRVVLTRQGDQLLSFDERAEIANAEPNVIFLTLHVGSAGAPGTVRTYYFAGFPPEPDGDRQRSVPLASTLLRWERAQEPYLETSQRLAVALQAQFAQQFRGSPDAPSAAAVRQLRNIAAPAVAIELSSVAVSDPRPLEDMAAGLSDAVVRAMAAFRAQPAGEAQ